LDVYLQQFIAHIGKSEEQGIKGFGRICEAQFSNSRVDEFHIRERGKKFEKGWLERISKSRSADTLMFRVKYCIKIERTGTRKENFANFKQNKKLKNTRKLTHN